ncbi:MAG: COG4315 family predicted lipoprotein [Chloroflexota bacterium]
MTLYYFKMDRRGRSACTGQCSHTWKPLVATRSSLATRNHLRGRLKTIRRPDGRRQVTYRGWPLYTFIGDRKSGNAFGQGILGQWFVATPSLAARTVEPIATATPTPIPTNTAPAPTAAPLPTAAPTVTPVPTTAPPYVPPATAVPYAPPPASTMPAPTPTPTRMSPTYPPPANTPAPVNCIPGNNGGDMDGDNNSEPSDGDGCQ